MLDDEKLVKLLIRRDGLLEQGRDATPEEVCEDCPGFVEEYKARLASLKRTDWLFETDDGEDDDSVTRSPSATASSVETELPPSSLTIEQFLRAITDSGLMNAEELQAFQKSVSTDVSTDSQSLARELVQRNRLTLYQASVLLAERSDPLLLDRYIILDAIDSGGMGLVFKALHRSLDRVVALKTLPPAAVNSEEKVQRFQREAKMAAMLSHANIVTTHDAHESNGVHFLVMEYVKGKDLGKIVRAKGPLPVAAALDYIIQAARGLEHAHAEGIVHRDIKPGNLLLDADGTVKVLDLGLARLEISRAGVPATEEELTADGGVMGTAAYMPPEQAKNAHDADARSDIYSLGCTLYFLLTSKPPYKSDSLVNTVLAHCEKPIPPLSKERDDVPEDVIAVYRRMLAKKPKDRYPSMTEVIEALNGCEILGEELIAAGQSSEPVEETIAYSREAKKHQWWVIGAVVILLMAVAILAGVVFKIGRPPRTLLVEVNEPGAEGQIDDGKVTPVKPAEPFQWPAGAPRPAIAPFDAEQAKKHQQVWADHLGVPVEMTNSIGMKMVLIPPGEFMMGSSKEEYTWLMDVSQGAWWQKRLPNEVPQHRVRITKPLYVGEHEVTVGQFRVFVEASGYKTEAESDGRGGNVWTGGDFEQRREIMWKNVGFEQTDEHPVVQVSWNDCVAFCRWLSENEGESYGLPTEAQWEYACRGGSTARWCSGDDEADLEEYAWYANNGGATTREVGRKSPNGFGIFDMHGNVREWCLDLFNGGYYKVSPVDDPSGMSVGAHRVLRGGYWNGQAMFCRSAYRHGYFEYRRYDDLGFRVALVVEDTKRDTGTPKTDSIELPTGQSEAKTEGLKAEATRGPDVEARIDFLPAEAPEQSEMPETERPSGKPTKEATNNESTETDQ